MESWLFQKQAEKQSEESWQMLELIFEDLKVPPSDDFTKFYFKQEVTSKFLFKFKQEVCFLLDLHLTLVQLTVPSAGHMFIFYHKPA